MWPSLQAEARRVESVLNESARTAASCTMKHSFREDRQQMYKLLCLVCLNVCRRGVIEFDVDILNFTFRWYSKSRASFPVMKSHTSIRPSADLKIMRI